MTQPVVAGQVDATPVVDLAQHVLDTIVAYYEAAGVDLPERRVIVIGELTVESECLGVMFGGLHVGPPGNEVSQPYKGSQPRTAVFSIELWREVATRGGGGARARAPRAQTITDQANVAMIDCWLLEEAGFICDEMNAGVIATVAPLPPQGGMQGVSMDLSIQVP